MSIILALPITNIESQTSQFSNLIRRLIIQGFHRLESDELGLAARMLRVGLHVLPAVVVVKLVALAAHFQELVPGADGCWLFQ